MRRALLFVVFVIVSLSAKAYDFEQDGIYYTIGTDGLWVGRHEYKGDIVIPSTVTFEGIEYSVVGIGDKAFLSCSGLTSITIPNSVTSIGENAFSYCSGLTSITIPNSVTSIGGGAFGGCSSLTSITIPNSVTSIGLHAFTRCSGLTSITIPNSVTSIGTFAFYECTSLTSITIGNSVTSIGHTAFEGCSSLKSVTLHCSKIERWFDDMPSIQEIVLGEEVTSIGNYAFENCTSLTSIVIPNSVTTIGEKAFRNCTSLSSVVIPNNVTTIGRQAFENCSSLSYLYLPSSITEMGYEAFQNCTSLLSVDIHATIVQGWAFRRCAHLKTVNLYNSVKTFSASCVDKCADLISITSNNPNPPDAVQSFTSNVAKHVILFVPKGSEEVYRKAIFWSSFMNIKAIGEDDNTDNTNKDDTTTDDNNTDDDKTDDGFSDGDSGWSINIKIKGEEIAQCSINNIESIEFTEDGLYIIINYKDGKSAKYDMSKFESIGFSENSDNNEVADGDTNESNPLTLMTSNDVKYVLLSGPMVSDGDNVNGNLADDGTIYWYMTPQSSWSPQYVHLLLGEKKSISDFPKGYDLGQPSINFGMVRSRENEYGYDSGSIKVTNNDGKSFTLEFNNYKASKSSGASITLNGSLYVEKERYY